MCVVEVEPATTTLFCSVQGEGFYMALFWNEIETCTHRVYTITTGVILSPKE